MKSKIYRIAKNYPPVNRSLMINVTILMKIVGCAFVLLMMIHLMREVSTPPIVCNVYQSKSNTSSKLLQRQIRLEQKRIELKAAYNLMKAQEAKARAQKAEARAKLRLEKARIETEQKLLDCSEKGFSAAVARK